ncbi:hypothetical protein CENSYa_1622 [Cenarchaeum symbiosum A]|uniref:Uncharacterized protein n=1 Tax=Cenarchaeum symbiosum (strain A) TaxID=414004 RepID=A0RY24_CENSY|nr:hypothetical protein CENSYa_1622 [Cenarchaeum symbiosum A]
MGRININVSSVDYDQTSRDLASVLGRLEAMVHVEDGFKMTDSEYAFGWHFFVVSVDTEIVEKLASQMGPDFEKLQGKGIEKKFLTWLSDRLGSSGPRFKLAIKEEMESSKYGIF